MDQRKKREKSFHNKIFEEKTRIEAHKYHSVATRGQNFYKHLLLKNCNNKQVLDYGCGTGDFSILLAKNGAGGVTGIDLSDVAINMANAKIVDSTLGENISFHVMDAENLTFNNNTFDLVYGMAILHHLDLKKCYSEIARVLKPNGMAIFLEPLGHNLLINLYRKYTPHLRTKDEHPLLMHDLDLAKNYFNKTNFNYYHLFSFLAVPFRNLTFFSYFVSVLDKIDSYIFKMFPYVRRHAWIVIEALSKPKKN